MEKKYIYGVLLSITAILSVISFVFSVYLFATKPKTSISVFDMCKDSVVEIKAETEDIGASYGTGEIISKDGTLVTNAHVITYTKLFNTTLFDTVYIRFVDEKDYREVDVVRYDLDLDIAVLKLDDDDKEITPIKIGDDNKLSEGDVVYAIGNMSNYGLSLTKGIISIPHINVSYNDVTRSVIQCDLTISDGSSGGALIDSQGELIGITTFRLKDNSNNVIYGIAYCIPINVAMGYVAG